MAYKVLSSFRYPPGRFNDFYARGGTINMPPGKRYGVIPRQNYPDSLFLNGGVYYIATKAGGDIQAYSSRTGTPRSRLSSFTENPDWIMDFLGSKYLPNWTREECRACIDFEVARRNGLPALWIDATESYGPSFMWRNGTSYAPNQVKWMCERIQEIQDAAGWSYVRDYAGAIDFQIIMDQQNVSSLITPFASTDPAVILAKFKEMESGDYKYFQGRYWENHDMLISTYWLNRKTPYEFVFKCLAALDMGKRAMAAPEVTLKRKICAYGMQEGVQSFDYTQLFPTSPFTGGTIGGKAFPQQDYDSHVALACMMFMFTDYSSQWADGMRHGVNYDVIQASDWELGLIPNGQSYRRATETYEYRNGDVAINFNYFGNNNGEDDGARRYGLMYEHIGNQNYSPCRYRPASGGSYNNNDGAHLIRAFLEGKPFCYKGLGTGAFAGNKVVFGYTNDGNWQNLQFDLEDGTTFTPDEKDQPVPGSFFGYLIKP